jgi:hypothetical protein
MTMFCGVTKLTEDMTEALRHRIATATRGSNARDFDTLSFLHLRRFGSLGMLIFGWLASGY